ncbi:MAG: nitroreductase family protein [Bacteroidales bacterium]|nr:nitroreductase family protein [Bacteroidales bacterium]
MNMSAPPKYLRQLVEKNRSYRKFRHGHEISEGELLQMIDLARLTPSSKNRQPLKYILVHDEVDTRAVFPHLRWAWYLKNWSRPTPEERPSAYIVMLLDKQLNTGVDIEAGIAAQTILLAAAEMDLGGCIIHTNNRYELSRYFQLPESLEIVLVIALGKPAQEVVVDEIENDQSIIYYLDADQKHHVPKRKLKDVIWKPSTRQ